MYRLVANLIANKTTVLHKIRVPSGLDDKRRKGGLAIRLYIPYLWSGCAKFRGSQNTVAAPKKYRDVRNGTTVSNFKNLPNAPHQSFANFAAQVASSEASSILND